MAGTKDGLLLPRSQMEKIVAATLLALGSRELSGRIHINSAGRHENSAGGCIVMEKALFQLSTV